MQEINIVGLLSKYSGEIVVSACIACALSFIFKKLLKLSNKIFIFLSFIIGVGVYLIIAVISLDGAIYLEIANAITCGGLSAIISLFVKKFAFMDNGDIKKELEKLLSSIVLSEQLDEVVDNILEKIASCKTATSDELKEILKENLSSIIDESDIENVVSFILSCCDFDSNDDDTENWIKKLREEKNSFTHIFCHLGKEKNEKNCL